MNIEKDKNLLDLNTFMVPSVAREYIKVKSIEEIKESIQEGKFQNTFYILGGGSNTLFTDYYNGIVVNIDLQGKEVIEETDEYVKLKISAGEDWPEIVKWTVENNWLGLQNLAEIPGTTGATPVQNVGAYGSEIKDVIETVNIIDLETGEEKTLNAEECKFEYRNSIFKNNLKGKAIITSIVIKLTKHPEGEEIPSKYLEYGGIQKELENNFDKPYTLQKVFQAITNIRNNKLPKVGEYGSCGSTFANPILPREQYTALLEKYPELPGYDMPGDMVKIPAAYILEQIGWKNKRILDGKCGTWIHHPLIVTNYHDSTGKEILELIKQIQSDFKQKTDLELNTEINII